MKIGLQTWGSEGDIRPFIALSAGLVRAGHEVTLVVTDDAGRDYGDHARQFGFRLVDVRGPALSSEELEVLWRQIIKLGDPFRQAKLIMRRCFEPATERLFEAAKILCATNDAVVGHFLLFPLRAAAEEAKRPMATVNLTHSGLPSVQIRPPGLPDLGSWSYPLGWKLVRTMVNRVFLPPINALRERQGLAPDRDVMLQTWTSERLNLVAVSPSICPLPIDWNGRHDVCGFLNFPAGSSKQEMPDGLNEFIAAGQPPIYFTFGSMMFGNLDYLSEVAALWTAAARKMNRRAILQLPWDDLSAFPDGDGNFKVRSSSHRDVFPRCSMIVHHGGAGTTQSSLLAGRPSVVVAHLADQFFWGSELQRLGVAGPTRRRKRLTVDGLVEAILHIRDRPQMAERASRVGSVMAREDGVAAAVALIEARLSTRVRKILR